MKTAMQELIDELQAERKNIPISEGWVHSFYKTIIDKAEAKIEKEKKQIIAPVNRLCDFYGHPHVGEQMYQTWYVTPKLKPIANI